MFQLYVLEVEVVVVAVVVKLLEEEEVEEEIIYQAEGQYLNMLRILYLLVWVALMV